MSADAAAEAPVYGDSFIMQSRRHQQAAAAAAGSRSSGAAAGEDICLLNVCGAHMHAQQQHSLWLVRTACKQRFENCNPHSVLLQLMQAAVRAQD